MHGDGRGIWGRRRTARHEAGKAYFKSLESKTRQNCKGLTSFSKIPEGRKLSLTTFYFPCNSCFLSWPHLPSTAASPHLPDSLPASSFALAPVPEQSTFTEHTEKHSVFPLPRPVRSSPHPSAFLWEEEFLLSKARPLDSLGPQVLQEGPQSSLDSRVSLQLLFTYQPN